MTAKDYSVTFGFGAYDGVFYSKEHPHRGNDRPTPTGTPIVIGNTTIGLTGATGLVSGPHLHTQAGNDFYAQNPFNPTGHEFKAGTVVQTGTASEWGNYIIIKSGDVYVVYAHLSKINVRTGQGVGMATSASEVTEVYEQNLFRKPDPNGLKTWMGKDPLTVRRGVSRSGEAKTMHKKAKEALVEVKKIPSLEAAIADKDKLLAQIRADAESVQGALKEDLAKANDRIIELAKENETIKEDLEEALKPVDEKEVVRNVFSRAWQRILDWLFNKETK